MLSLILSSNLAILVLIGYWFFYMFDDASYKVSFIFALALHIVLSLFFLIKFVHSKPLGLVPGNIINATAISERDFDRLMSQRLVNQVIVPKQKKAESVVTKQLSIIKESTAPKKQKNQLQAMLKKNLLQEQAHELAELKKEEKRYKKTAARLNEQKFQKILQEQIDAEKKQLSGSSGAEAHGSIPQGEIDKYKVLVKQAIDSQWIKPDGSTVGDFCELLVSVELGGKVLEVKLVRSSGNLALDRSAEAAIMKASPLPVPGDPKLFDEFRTIKPVFKPEGIVGN